MGRPLRVYEVRVVDGSKALIDPPIEVEPGRCKSLVGLLTRALPLRSSLPRASTPVAPDAPALCAYSGVGRAGFTPASQLNQTMHLYPRRRGRVKSDLITLIRR